jgi:hypothetical protein
VAAKAPDRVSHASLDELKNMTMPMMLSVIKETKAKRIA